MANEVSKKLVVIRKKMEAPEGGIAESRAVDVAAAPAMKGSSEKRKARRKRQSEKWREEHPGLRFVQFVVEIELWDQFVARCCAEHKPNVVFARMIREAVQAKAARS